MILRCTAKLLKEIGMAKADLVENTSPESPLGEWYIEWYTVATASSGAISRALWLPGSDESR